ncbi:hypothetical protein CcaverHIS002_0404920 [Cutaneotrichosporon cavernicola]|uniref:Chromatin modification-related protein EAF6 n=1 Tax=Cutaneotrichosporon cavernicola TaxID=279322 RepID=A0AA48L482_9TREE|nr:uncharacterized protein CcaverHIS019_0404890 [Cutaneotrichosporon cavernicola]BEI83888.1 hypothetical protein CcaverHIS002_0404920 [Cutaneotrichosporon cavernicola]BEI91669.1 hypothetical protein CcaverHIS019_0404890 [Cutaneotrichosporon cavernicola]BEI99444.1 hypothetical protein CcaverHIS631_0404870 [Cutaneotrichosporon cavernicola]BEJ07222.1 hypothetical protein CcaverHIS641_0404910 [Cutaneotrichosporon cavernicola]
MSTQGPPANAKQAQAAALTEVEAAQRRKRALDLNLASIEATIWAQETSYLEDTATSGGNIIKGFENYLKAPTVTSHHRRKNDPTEDDKLFSGSSTSFNPMNQQR